jgi:hypothetical protein
MHETDIGPSDANAADIVTAVFATSYARLARRFGEALAKHAIPHMLYNWCQRVGQSNPRKTLVVQRAVQGFSGRDVSLMDIDCEIRGRSHPLPSLPAIYPCSSAWVFIPSMRRAYVCGQPYRHRFVVLRPTGKAHRPIDAWQRLCQQQSLVNQRQFKRRSELSL